MPASAISIVTADNEKLIASRRNELMLAPFRLSLWAQRLFLYVISQVEDHHADDHRYTFPVAHLARKVGVENPNLYRGIIDVIDELERAKVWVPDLSKEGAGTRVGLIKNRQRVEAPSEDEKGPSGRRQGRVYAGGLISIELWPELMPYVKDLRERYTDIELRYAFQLRSSYGQKLYDILKTQEFHGRPFSIGLAELRQSLALTNEFTRYPDFRRFVLDRARADINERTDLRFTYTPATVGKKVVRLTFTLSRGHKPKVEFLPASRADDLYRLLVRSGLPGTEAVKAVRSWSDSDPDRITWHVAEMKRKADAGEIKKAPLAWLRAGLRQDYRRQGRLDGAERQKEKGEQSRDLARRNASRVGGTQHIKAVLQARFGAQFDKEQGA